MLRPSKLRTNMCLWIVLGELYWHGGRIVSQTCFKVNKMKINGKEMIISKVPTYYIVPKVLSYTSTTTIKVRVPEQEGGKLLRTFH